MAFDWGAFAGGIGSGIEQGQRIRAQQQTLADAARQRAARADYARTLLNPIDPQQAPMQQAPMPGATPMPGPAPSPTAPTGPPPPVSAPAPAAPAAPAAPPAQQSTVAPPPTIVSGGQTDPDYAGAFKAGQKMIQDVARQIKAANPGKVWKDPAELLDAIEANIKTVESVNPIEKIAAQAQLAASKAQYDTFRAGIAAQEEDRKRAADAEKAAKDERTAQDREARMAQQLQIAKQSSDTRLKIASMQEYTRMAVEKMIQGGADQRAANLLQYRYAAQQAGLDEKTATENLRAELQARSQDTSWMRSEETAEIGAGQKPQNKAPKIGSGPTPKMRGAKVGGATGSGKPVPASTMAQWKQVPPQNKAAAKQHLADQGFDVSGLE